MRYGEAGCYVVNSPKALDVKAELITLAQTEVNLDIEKLPSYVPSDSPRYHILYFPHDFDGDHYPSFGELITSNILCVE